MCSQGVPPVGAPSATVVVAAVQLSVVPTGNDDTLSDSTMVPRSPVSSPVFGSMIRSPVSVAEGSSPGNPDSTPRSSPLQSYSCVRCLMTSIVSKHMGYETGAATRTPLERHPTEQARWPIGLRCGRA